MATTTAVPGRFAAPAGSSSSFLDLLLAITMRDLRARYHGTALNYFWWVARPLTLGLVLWFAMSRVLDVGIDNHAAFLLAALFPWFWFQATLTAAAGSFLSNAGLIKKVRFSRVVLPLSVVLGGTIEFLVTLPVLLVLMVVTGVDAEWRWVVGVPVLVALQFALLAGLGIAVALVNVYVRDLGPALGSALTLLFYLTPIIYPLDRVPDGYRAVLRLNPLAPLIEAWRGLLMRGELPDAALWPTVLFAGAALALGSWALRVAGRGLADAL